MEEQVQLYGIYERYETQRCMVGADIISVLRQLARLAFTAGGSLYYVHDLENVTGRAAILLKDERFRVGPETVYVVWQEITRKPRTVYATFYLFFLIVPLNQPITRDQAALAAAAARKLISSSSVNRSCKFRRERRDGYQYQEHAVRPHRELEALFSLHIVFRP